MYTFTKNNEENHFGPGRTSFCFTASQGNTIDIYGNTIATKSYKLVKYKN